MAFGRVFPVFLHKNLLYIKFNLTELLLIHFGSYLILLLFLSTSKTAIDTPAVVYDSVTTDILKERFPANDGDFIYYTPSTKFTDDLMERVRWELQLLSDKVQPIRNVNEMRLLLEKDCRGNCFAVDFSTAALNDTTANQHIEYAISSSAIRISPNKHYVNDETVVSLLDEDDYLRSGFYTLQQVIDAKLIKELNPSSPDYEIEIVSMPSKALQSHDGSWVLSFGLLFGILFGIILLCTFLVPLVEEKQDGIKEFLIIATSQNYLNGLAFFILRLALYLILLTATLLVAQHWHALGVSSNIYIVTLYILYMLSYMAYAYLISVLFHSVFYAKIGGAIMLIAPYIFYLVEGGLSNVATYFFSTKAFIEDHSISFGDLDEHITENSHSLLGVYGILILQSLLYSLVYNYLANVFPGPGGLKKPYLFFLKSFNTQKQKNEYTTGERCTDAIIIQDLEKKFRRKDGEVLVADRLNMVIKNRQITVLLGHNGAGKTTTINMIMGSVPKDGGKILVCSERDVSSYRHLIGLCPQHSVFMAYMTCLQHLEFFAQLRGMSKQESNVLANSLLRQLKLEHKANEFGKNLSGGMKRRLSLGIALSGDTKVVILDEPSSGLDIDSRRKLWDILLELRKKRAILVTTHHMEEAEILGDTVSILANGRLQHTGSPLELKRKVGSGYILKLSTRPEGFQQTEVLQLIQTFIPNAHILNVVPPTVLISLPYSNKSSFSEMLSQLEQQQDDLGIISISVTDTSLEDVFLNCAYEGDQVDGPTLSHAVNGNLRNSSETRVPYQRLNKSFKITTRQQFLAIAYKKCIFIRNEWLYMLLMTLVPFIAVSLATFLMYYVPEVKSEALPLNPGMLREGVIYLRNDEFPDMTDMLKKTISPYSVTLKNLELREGRNVTQELFALQEEDYANFLQNVVGVIEIERNDATPVFKLHFSANILHSTVMLLNIVDNVLLQLNGNANVQLDTSYYPIRRFLRDINPSRLEYYVFIVPIGLFLYLFSYLVLPFRENISGFKNLQAIPRATYWLSVFTIDTVLHLTVCVILGIWQWCIMPQELYNSQEQLLIIFTFIFHGISYFGILYAFANCLRSISTIATYLLFMVMLSAILPLLTSANIKAIEENETYIFFLSFLPDFNLNHQLRLINENFIIERKSLKTHDTLNTFTFFIYAVFISALTLTFLIRVFENKRKMQRIRSSYNRLCNIRKLSSAAAEEEDLVKQQRTIVQEVLTAKQEPEYPLLVNNLLKCYDRRVAVRSLNFLVHKQECFGLLGVNGAGKSTTFEMITANLPITGGSCKIDGVDCIANEYEYRYRFGYCPQGDCLNNFMTAYQMLAYMGRLRGVDSDKLDDEVRYWLEELDLMQYRNVQIRYYSGGTKRKLNAAIAMIGSPSLILLDEPTTGVDPVSRRFLWKCIRDFQKNDRTIVLTSHSMDECEQLCNRLAIMTEGHFKCLGNIQDLKLRYGSGITIHIKLRDENLVDPDNRIETSLQSLFMDCEFRECHAGISTYFIKNEYQRITWSEVFKKTEIFFAECDDLIEDYSVNESTLEDICLRFEKRSSIETPPIETTGSSSSSRSDSLEEV